MRRRVFGSTGLQVPIIGQGTWRFEQERHPQRAIRALQTGIDLGLAHIDTAEMYGDGVVEELVGRAIAGRRDEVFLASKVWPTNASRAGTIEACERSLRRLGTEYLDLYLLHRTSGFPLADTFSAFEKLVEAGKIRAWGVSNFQAGDIRAALALAGPGTIACNQVSYQLQSRWVEGRLLPLCRANDIALVAYSPLGAGSFPSPTSPGGRVLVQVAQELGVSPRAVALSFLSREESVFAIPKASRKEHVRENAAGDVVLSEEQASRIDKAFAHRPGIRTRLGALSDRFTLRYRKE